MTTGPCDVAAGGRRQAADGRRRVAGGEWRAAGAAVLRGDPLSGRPATVFDVASTAECVDFARAHLPQPLAEAWIRLLRPAVQFPRETAAGEGPALRVGGDPGLPQDVEWPRLEGYGPLSFVAEMDCAAVAAAGGVDLLPESGHLLFFAADGRCDEVGCPPMERSRFEWARVVHVAGDVPRAVRPAPRGLEPYGTATRPARAVSTPPSTHLSMLEHNFGAEVAEAVEQAGSGHPFRSTASEREVRRLRGEWCQTGGHSHSIVASAEVQVAADVLGGGRAHTGSEIRDEAGHWRVLFQIPDDDDLDIVWGGGSIGYWMIRDDDLAARRFERVWLGFQC